MTHLSPSELVDLVEGTLAPGRAGHVERCERCRVNATAAREALALAREAEVPDPSPLFWEHFSARVRAEIATEPIPVGGRAWFRSPVVALGGALAILVVAALLTWRGPAPSDAGDPPAVGVSLHVPADVLVPYDGADDDPWDLIVSAARGMGWDDAEEAGIAIGPGAADGALLLLSAEERTALVGLLRAELPDVEG